MKRLCHAPASPRIPAPRACLPVAPPLTQLKRTEGAPRGGPVFTTVRRHNPLSSDSSRPSQHAQAPTPNPSAALRRVAPAAAFAGAGVRALRRRRQCLPFLRYYIACPVSTGLPVLGTAPTPLHNQSVLTRRFALPARRFCLGWGLLPPPRCARHVPGRGRQQPARPHMCVRPHIACSAALHTDVDPKRKLWRTQAPQN